MHGLPSKDCCAMATIRPGSQDGLGELYPDSSSVKDSPLRVPQGAGGIVVRGLPRELPVGSRGSRPQLVRMWLLVQPGHPQGSLWGQGAWNLAQLSVLVS